jgi:hypothetical protein
MVNLETLIYLLTHKFEAFPKFQLYKEHMENQINKQKCILRFDKRGERGERGEGGGGGDINLMNL